MTWKTMFLAGLIALSAFSQEIRIASGITDGQVLQRNAAQTSEVHLNGTATGKKVNGITVEARLVSSDGAPIPSLDWKPIGKVQKLKWSGELKGIPVGGPYRLDVRLTDTEASTSISNILVGDLWILAGQSNMEGHGELIDVQPPSPMVHSFDMADQWVLAEEPLHTSVNAVDPVHWPLNAENVPERWEGERLEGYLSKRRKGAGLGLPFAAEMVKRTDIPVGLIPCAHEGTSLDQWSPSLKDRGGESLYGSMLRRFHAAGGQVRGVLWYQGESDANQGVADAFQRKFESFVKSVRDDFGEPDMPFYYIQIGRHLGAGNTYQWNTVQTSQLRAEADLPRTTMVSSVDLGLDDNIHLGTEDLKRLGRRLANLASRDLFGYMKNYGQLKIGPRPTAAKFSGGVLRVSFSQVNGRLESEGRIAGFSIHSPDGRELPLIYKARVDPAEASTVLLFIEGDLPQNAMVWYGYGQDPYCNLRDAADMAIPVFSMRVD